MTMFEEHRPVVIDSMCCEGGAAAGLWDAGFQPIGIDHDQRALKRYPFPHFPGDVFTLVPTLVAMFGAVAVWASPHCQPHSASKHAHSKQYPDQLEDTRALLRATGLPYIIENVERAPLLDPITLCGATFGLTAIDDDGQRLVMRRHRKFETNAHLFGQPCECAEYKRRGYRVAGAYGGGSSDKQHAQHVRRGGYTPSKRVQENMLGIGWMTRHGLNQSVPPAYSRYLGVQLMDAISPALAG
jgi:DNA (cytosine-5)-methyltransferase 1